MQTEEVKEPKKKASKVIETKTVPSGIQALIDIGIPVKFACFNKTVLSYLKTPETAFRSPEANLKSSRRAKMWYTPHGLVTEQEGVYKIIPLANVSDTIVA